MPYKPCEVCGKTELIVGRGKYCRTCRKEKQRQWRQAYYVKNWKEIRKKAEDKRVVKKAQSKSYAAHERPKTFPVVFEHNADRYSWQVRFTNPLTGRLVVWQSEGDFATLRDAQKDYVKACGR